MAIDSATRANLEIARTLGGERRGSLLHAIDRCVTASGSRLLAQRLAAPLTDPALICERFDAVEFHRFLMELGPAPFDIVYERFDRWLASQTDKS